jgi:hypothetical protein
MGQQILPAAVVCEAALEFEEIDGLVYVSDPTLPHRKAMRRRVFLASFHNAAKLLQDLHARQDAEVIEFPAAHG